MLYTKVKQFTNWVQENTGIGPTEAENVNYTRMFDDDLAVTTFLAADKSCEIDSQKRNSGDYLRFSFFIFTMSCLIIN